MQQNITKLFNIQHPIVQGGMIWVSGYKLAAAVSNAGGLGLIGAGSMYPEVLRTHIQKCKKATKKPFGVNVPLLYPDIEKIMEIIISSNWVPRVPQKPMFSKGQRFFVFKKNEEVVDGGTREGGERLRA